MIFDYASGIFISLIIKNERKCLLFLKNFHLENINKFNVINFFCRYRRNDELSLVSNVEILRKNVLPLYVMIP